MLRVKCLIILAKNTSNFSSAPNASGCFGKEATSAASGADCKNSKTT